MTTKNGKKKNRKAKPDKLAASGRDENGKFLPGHEGIGGRPKGMDFRKAIERWAAENKVDLELAAGQLAKALHARGINDDTAAAKLWLDRCYGLQKQELEVQSTAVVYITDEARADLKKMMRNGTVQEGVLDELERRTVGDGE